ncbi:MetQ/NlpA family ABC transporter substrate-binding protein [Microbacterium aoyamense]|uniref:MetQ/NlpA family ABC transporter substrate-binding protein n=1 Tax=Microbacterium aoyamense TaxID=344166 RepID=A0ABP5B5V8_9MICO|nr:ABC transporter substrate-binding protein [Microbacterium aoyamense]
MRLAARTPARSAAVALAAVAAVALSACTSGGSATPTESGGLTPVTIGEVSPFQAANYLTLVADEQGFFEDHGIDAEIIGISQNPIAPLLSGDIDISSVGVNGMAGLEQGQDIRFIAAFPASVTFSLIVPAGSAAVDNAHEWPDVMEDLVGQSLGTTVPGALVDNMAKFLVTDAGLSASDIAVTPAGDGAALVAGLLSGSFDSGLVPSPLFEPLVASGDFVQVLDLYAGDVPDFNIPVNTPAVTAAFAEENPDVIAGFQQAIEEANTWAKDPANKEALAEMIATRLDVEPADVAAPLETFIAALGDTSEYTEEQWNSGVEMLTANGVLTKDYSYTDFVIPFSG